MTNARHLKW